MATPVNSDRRILELAARQHGLVSRRQLLSVGLTPRQIQLRVECGRLPRVRRGIYRAHVRPDPRERLAAAVLACGPSAVLSHESAAALWTMLPDRLRDPTAEVHVTLSRGRGRRARGVRVHRCRSLPADERTRVHQLPVTTAPRTVLDLASSTSGPLLERVVARCEREGWTTAEDIRALLARHPARPGSRRLAELLAREDAPAFTRSEAERALLDLVRRAELARPEVNARLRGWEVDFLWRAQRLVVETDGFAYHGSASAFETDRERDARLVAAGYRVLRVTWRQLTETPEAVLVRIAQALVAG